MTDPDDDDSGTDSDSASDADSGDSQEWEDTVWNPAGGGEIT